MGNQSTKVLKNDDYWRYQGILIPNHIEFVESIDKVNVVYKEGIVTQSGRINQEPYARKEYRRKYAELKNGKWYWKEKKWF